MKRYYVSKECYSENSEEYQNAYKLFKDNGYLDGATVKICIEKVSELTGRENVLVAFTMEDGEERLVIFYDENTKMELLLPFDEEKQMPYVEVEE